METNKVFLSFEGKESSLECLEKPLDICLKSDGLLLSQSIVENNNLLFRCDNLIALNALYKLNCCFDVIYIDPPYNTKTQFTYNDNHGSQSSWLCMMYPRLVLAHKLLSEDGIFYISIDDREVCTLTVLLREIFDIENHIGTIKWRKKRKPSFLDKHLSCVIEYVLIFCKDKRKLKKLKGELSEEQTRPVLNAGNAPSLRVLLKGTKAFCKDGLYSKGIYKNKTLDIELLEDALIKDGILQNDLTIKGRFRVSQEIISKTTYITKQFGLRRFVLDEEKSFKHALDDATVNYETNEDGESQLKELFYGNKVFDYPKPVGLIKNLLNMYNPSKNKIACLDFFAGSGTLAQAVYELNSESHSSLKFTFCCVQNEEPYFGEHAFTYIADILEKRIFLLEKKHNPVSPCLVFKG